MVEFFIYILNIIKEQNKTKKINKGKWAVSK